MEIVIHLFQHTMNLRFLNTRRLAHLQYHSTEQLRRITTPVPNMNSTVETYPHLVVPSTGRPHPLLTDCKPKED